MSEQAFTPRRARLDSFQASRKSLTVTIKWDEPLSDARDIKPLIAVLQRALDQANEAAEKEQPF